MCAVAVDEIASVWEKMLVLPTGRPSRIFEEDVSDNREVYLDIIVFMGCSAYH